MYISRRNANTSRSWSRFHARPLPRCDANHLWHVCLFKNRAATVPESLLYLYHQEGVCVILGVGGRSSPLRLPVKFGQVTVTRSGPRPPQRTGNAKQEVAVNDVRR